jgi:ribose 1,5-bisphosphokinase PhnN
VRALARRGVLRVHPTWTTRPRREDERTGEIEHRFVDDATFDRLAGESFFLGTVTLAGLPYRYGLPRPRLTDDGPIDTVMARAPFVELFAAHFPQRLVYQIEDTPERARARLAERGCDTRELHARVDQYIDEARAGHAVAHLVFRNSGSLAELIDAFEEALRQGVAA